MRPSTSPSFSKGFLNEVQVIGYLLSTDQVNEADVLMVNGASAALMISDIPWNGPSVASDSRNQWRIRCVGE